MTDLDFNTVDPEARFGLPCGRNTNPSNMNALVLGCLFTTLFYAACFLLWKAGFPEELWEWTTGFEGIPILIVFFGAWSLGILLIKYLKIRAQRKALKLNMIPDQAGFALTRQTVDDVLTHIETEVTGADRFLLIHRVVMALRSVKNTGRIAETDTVIESIADSDESIMESGYTVLRGFIWAIPIIGFLGTIIGLTQAIGRFADVLGDGGLDKDTLITSLGGVMDGLNVAFVTTGEALACALLIQLILTFVRNLDEAFLDDCRRYTSRHILPRLRVERLESE